MKIELNGKALLAVGLLSAGLAFGEYVSVINSSEVSYVTAQPPQETTSIGSIVLRIDAVNPADIYGGTWELIREDATFGFGDGSDYSSAVAVGDNDPTVPLPEHSHTMNHDHPSVNTNTDTHNHGLRGGNNDAMDHYYRLNRNRGIAGINPSEGQSGYTSSTTLMSNDSHSHSVNLPNYTGNTGNAGQSNATLDVRGKRLMVNVWKRIG